MSDMTTRGPRNPSRIIFVTVALFGSTVGFATASLAWFTLAVLGSAALTCAGYGLIRRRLGWKPLSGEYLSNLIYVVIPY